MEFLVKVRDFPLESPICDELVDLPNSLNTHIFRMIHNHMKKTKCVVYSVSLHIKASSPAEPEEVEIPCKTSKKQ